MILAIVRCAVASASLFCACLSHAQDANLYPTKPVRWIAPYPAGGSSDFVARIVAHKFSDSYGQQFVVDNRAGAGGISGQ